ncbi:hypothetical protein PoMZ_01834 [Pyricularia oryzae]|uniref:Nuclear pore complex subunit Nup133 n=1 Tax=Pyricularia oryzae TaxID=318829 RepID=A0A4P7N7J8_PYROR|nr:hypothetical protein PoMZ_01834 [Pyricularia oryzae]
MFSPTAASGGPATATRSRRRQRPLSSESLVPQPKAKRQRLPLSEQTFVNPDTTEMVEVRSEKIAKLQPKHDRIISPPQPKQDLSVRSKKPKPGERISKGDGSVVLTTNNAYTVSKLPALPDRLRADVESQQHGALYSSTGHALTLTHTHAFVWPYTINNPSPETFIFNLDYPSRHSSDPLPLGSLVAPSASADEPGLVVVMPVSGKISYWESISSAATLTFMRQQRNGIEDAIPGMFSGEHVVQILNAETAGFILAFSSGRLAHLSVRDGHGRPTISVQFLRSGMSQTGGGFLGSIRHVLKHSAIRADLAAVRAGPPTKAGERNIAAATSKGKITTWRVQRGGHHDVLAEVDVRDAILLKLESRSTVGRSSASSSGFEILDIAFAPKRFEQRVVESPDGELAQQILLLVASGNKFESSYAIIEAIVRHSHAEIGMVRPITCYSSPLSQDPTVRPRLYIPNPGFVAFAVFDRAVVICSLNARPESPDAQIQDDLSLGPGAFEDVVDLRDRDTFEIAGSGLEEPTAAGQELESQRLHRHKTKNPAVLLIIRGVGVVRVATTDIERFGEETCPTISPKSKLEQAVFYGIKDDNPISFDGKRALPFSNQEIGEAALQLSNDILSSNSPHLLHVPAILEGNLRGRTSYLERLMSYLNSLSVDIDREVRWGLLWNAEKMSAATVLWKQHEQFLLERGERPGSDTRSIISEIVEFIHESEKKVPNQNKGELDNVRHWFTHDIGRLEVFVAWAYEVIKYKYQQKVANDADITRLMYEAMQVVLEALGEAFAYRAKKLEFYGLSNDRLERGVLQDGYEALSEPWTCDFNITTNTKRMMDLAHKWLTSYYPPSVTISAGSPDPRLIQTIRDRLPSLTDKYLLTVLERSRWALTRNNQKLVHHGEICRKTYSNDRYDKLVLLKDFGLFREAIRVAEAHNSIEALALLMVEEVKSLRQRALDRDQTPSRVTELRERARIKQHEIAESFDRFGDQFAFAVYDILLREEGVKAVLDFPGNRKGYATKFLRTKPELSKISWINDVEQEKDINHAAETLIELGLNREQQVWNKKIELSLGKLALLAEGATVNKQGPARNQLVVVRGERGDRAAADLTQINRELTIIGIQDKLYNLILPSVSMAVDEAAALELAMEYSAQNIPKKHKALARVFEDAMGRLLRHEALDPLTLIDLLTLVSIRHDPTTPGFNIYDDLYFSALRVSHLSLRGEEQQNTNRLIWRRCFIRDDWSKINNTQSKGDDMMSMMLGSTATYLTLYACHSYRNYDDKKFSSLVAPSDALGVYTDGLDRRFESMEETVKQKLIEAMAWENTELNKYITKCRLDHWHQTTVREAARMVDVDLDKTTAEGAAQANGDSNGALRANGNSTA